MEQKISKNSILTLLIVLLVTVLVAVIGVTYAYFQAEVTKTNVSSMLVEAADLSITYNETKNITTTNILPGWSDTKTFKVKNTGERTVEYNLLWTGVTNTLVNKSYLKYAVVGTGTNAFNTSSAVQFPSSDNSIASNISIGPNVEHSYTLTITYMNDPDFDQSDDIGKSFGAIIDITTNHVSE